jgi:hypothetical protein
MTTNKDQQTNHVIGTFCRVVVAYLIVIFEV